MGTGRNLPGRGNGDCGGGGGGGRGRSGGIKGGGIKTEDHRNWDNSNIYKVKN